MSRFFSDQYRGLIPYTPGEQPKKNEYIKLNTNESPFAPSPLAQEYAARAAKRAELYCDPDCSGLVDRLSALYGIGRDEVLFTNGSDEALNFAFMAFCDSAHPAVFPDITYGFYPVFAQINGVPYEEIPLRADFSVCAEDYIGINKTIFIANPNAPTGIALPRSDIDRIVSSNPDSVVVVDEAYVDFGTQSAVSLIRRYDNLLVTQTFSKSRSLAGARLGMAIGCPALIRDLNTIKYSTNPYNVNSLTQALGEGTLDDEGYTQSNCRQIIENRAYTADRLTQLGFVLTESCANFVFARHDRIGGEELYLRLKERGVLVRHFAAERICDYNRITIGTREQMDVLLRQTESILEEKV